MTLARDAEKYRASKLLYVAVLCSQMAPILMGASFGWSAAAMEEMDMGCTEWNSPVKPTKSTKNLIASILMIGALFGGFSCGFFLDFFGRRKTLVFLGLPYAVGWTLIAFAKSVMPILAGRTLTGLAIGVTTAAVPTYITEVSPPNIRGLLGMSFSLSTSLGIVYMNLIYTLNYHWNQLAVWALMPAVLLSTTMVLMPESPSWLINHTGQMHCAMVHLKRLRHFDSDVNGELHELIDHRNRTSQERYRRIKFSLSTFTRPDFYKPFLIATLVLFFQQFSGINGVQVYMNLIFKSAGIMLTPRICTLTCNCIVLMATVLGSFIIDRFGRRILMAISAFGMALSIGALGFYYFQQRSDLQYQSATNFPTTLSLNVTTPLTHVTTESYSESILPVICVAVFCCSYSMGLSPLVWILITEITPPQTLGIITTTSSTLSWVFSFVVVNEIETLSHVLQPYGAYWFFSGICFACVIFAYFLPETKGKTKEEISQIFGYH